MSRICPKCKNEVWDNSAKFCSMCGYSFDAQVIEDKTVKNTPTFSHKMNEYERILSDIANTTNTDNSINANLVNSLNNEVNYNYNNNEKHSYLKQKSFIIGIVSIVLAFLLGWLAIIPAVVGIVLSIKEGEKGKKSLILNIVAIILAVCITIIIATQFNGVSYKYAGKYSCSAYTSAIEEEDYEFAIDLKLGIDKSFEMKYGAPYSNMHIKGKYEVTNSYENHNLGTTGYTIRISTTYRKIEDKLLTEPYETEYALSFNTKTKDLIMTNPKTNNKFTCKKVN